jgi:hypothetical protein
MEDIIDIIVTETTNLITITSSGSDEVIDVNIIDNREDIVLNVTPTIVEININSLVGNFGVNWGQIGGILSNQTDLNTALGLKADLVGGLVPSSQLPSFVDDVIEVATFAALPITGEQGKIYVVLATNLIYRWSGSAYIEIKDSSAVWGAITGTLSNQIDLQNALNAKEPTITAGTTLQYYRGDKTFQALNTSIVPELTNLYYTEARVDANTNVAANTAARHNAVTIATANGLSLSTQALSLGLATSSLNGALSAIDWTTFNAKQAALSGTGFVKSAAGVISYDTSVYYLASNPSAFIALAALSAGAGISYNNTTGVIASTITQYTDALARAAISLTVTGASGASAYNNTTGVLNVPTYTLTGLGGQPLATNLTSLAGLTYASTSFVKMTAAGTFALDTTVYGTGSVTSVAAITLGTTGTDLSSTVATGTTTPVITLNVPTASAANRGALSAADWTTFNNKASTAALANYLPLSGGTLTGALSGTSATFSGDVIIANPSNNNKLFINRASSAYTSGIFYQTNGTSDFLIGQNPLSTGTSDLSIYNYGTSSVVFNIARSSGAATFSSSVTAATGNFSSSGSYILKSQTSTTTGVFMNKFTNGNDEGVFLFHNGSSAPAISGASTNSIGIGADYATAGGVYRDLCLATGGVARINITSGGNVGIGTTAPANKLSVSNPANGVVASFTNTADADLSINLTSGVTLLTPSTGILAFGTSSTERMRITSGGNVGIGTTAPMTFGNFTNLTIASTATNNFSAIFLVNSSVSIRGSWYQNGGTQINFGTATAHPLVFDTSDVERMRITSGGNVLIGTTTDSGYKLNVNGNAFLGNLASGNNVSLFLATNASGGPRSITYRAATAYITIDNTSGAAVMTVDNGGAVTASSFFESSDKTLKTLIQDNYQAKGIESVIAKLYTKNGKEELGYYAQDVQGILPSAVSKGADGLLSLSYREVHTAKISALEKRVEELEQQLKLN